MSSWALFALAFAGLPGLWISSLNRQRDFANHEAERDFRSPLENYLAKNRKELKTASCIDTHYLQGPRDLASLLRW